MTLFTTDYLEYYLTLLSWVIHNGIWAVLVSSGVFAIPFVAIIIQEWLRARAEGADEGNKGALSSLRIENRVWVAIVVLLATGYGLVFGVMGGFAGAGLHIHLMQAIGIAMMLLFLFLYFVPWRGMQRTLDAEDMEGAAGELAKIRRIVAINLHLGLLVIAIGASGRYWG